MRDYRIVVPQDCAASIDRQKNEAALEYIERVLKAEVRPSKEMDFADLLKS